MSDEPEQKPDAQKIKAPSDAAKQDGVISAAPNQEVHGKAFATAHKDDKYPSGIIPALHESFGIKGDLTEADTGTLSKASKQFSIFEGLAKQAVEPIPSLSSVLNENPYGSSVKLNVQITNVPEVSEGVKPEELLQYADTTFEAGAQAVRPIENWLATPNAVSDSLVQIGPALDNAVNYYANTPFDQVARDAQAAVGYVGEVLKSTLDYSLTPDERAKAAGAIMPMFFLEGSGKEPIHSETAQQLGLEGMSEAELTALGIRRAAQDATDLHMPEVPEHLKHLELQPASSELLNAMRNKGRDFLFAEPGSEEYRYLLAQRVEASTGRADMMHVLMKENPTKIAALEEFLHGTQKKIGLIDKVGEEVAEVRVKDFMLRHPRLLGLTDNDLTVLEALRQQEANYALRRGFSPRMFEVGGHE